MGDIVFLISLIEEEDKRTFLDIDVIDSGIGIEKER
jgi:hypothetical protein